MAGIDLNRTTSGVLLNPEESEKIIAKTLKSSEVMKMATRISLPGRGLAFQTITGEPEANWVTETDKKPKGVHTLGTRLMQGYTLAVIEPISNQLARDKKALVAELKNRLPKALAKKFDDTVLKGATTDAPGSNFDVFASVTQEVDIETPGIYAGLVDAEEVINENDYLISGYVMSPHARAKLLNAKDNQNRPLFLLDLKDGDTSRVLGHPTYFTNSVSIPATTTVAEQYGIAGDWSKALYGIVEDIRVDRSEQASITLADNSVINLWERNMFALRAEVEVGFMIGDTDAFVRLVGAEPTTGAKKADKKDK